MKKVIFSLLGMALALSSCKNGSQEFPDYIYQTISFAQQTPVRTITLGEDGEYDTSLDNAHIFQLCPVLGGVNTNKKTRWAQLEVDPTLIEGMAFADGSEMKLLPPSYYTFLNDTKVPIEKGKVLGYLKVHLEDAFFADPDAVNTCYVLPVRITSASDSILEGKPKVDGAAPSYVQSSQWSTLPKNYTIYAIKYKNQWAGTWLSKSKVSGVNNGVAFSSESNAANWESADIKYLTSKSLSGSHYSISHSVACTSASGAKVEKNISCDLLVDIDANGNVTVSAATPGCSASGNGKYTYHGAVKAWGNADRDMIELTYSYTIPYVVNEATGAMAEYTANVTETLVARDRQSKLETFSYTIR
ncbi:MAG: DUF5627 domain-containing protein [Staphylococcus sp.]|nr:DUF5627 domain-containing protein [Staphylococcus sp.]